MLENLILALALASNNANQRHIDDRNYDWVYDSRLRIPVENRFRLNTDNMNELSRLMLGDYSGQVLGFHLRDSLWDGEAPISKIVVPTDAPQWLVDHEYKHADGWYHPPIDPNKWGRWR